MDYDRRIGDYCYHYDDSSPQVREAVSEEKAVDVSKEKSFEFDYEEDGTLSLESAVFQSLGAASTCWESLDNTGVFDSTRAKEIGETLIEFIKNAKV